LRPPWPDFDNDEINSSEMKVEQNTELMRLTTANERLTFDLGPFYISLIIKLYRRIGAYFSPVVNLHILQAQCDIKDMGALSDSAREIKKGSMTVSGKRTFATSFFETVAQMCTQYQSIPVEIQ